MAQLDVTELMREALLAQAQALGAMDPDGRLTDPAAQARLTHDPRKPVLVALRPLPGEDTPVEYVPVRDLLAMRSISPATVEANAAAERAGWANDRARVRRDPHPDFRAWGGPSAAPAARERLEPTADEKASIAEKEAALQRHIARIRRAWAVPEAEVFGALLAERRVEFTGSGDTTRDALLLALVARIEKLEARIAELEGGAK